MAPLRRMILTLFYPLAFILASNNGGNPLVDSLSSISPESPYYSTAMVRLSEILMTENTVLSRRAAEEAMRNAIRTSPEDPWHYVRLSKIQFERSFYRSAFAACDDAIRINQSKPVPYHDVFSEAYYYKGLIKERQALKYKDMISPVNEDFSISLSNFGYEDMLESARYYEKALEYNGTHRDALFHLGLLYYEIRAFDKMSALFEKIVQYKPEDKDALMFLGLAYYHRGDFAQSHTYYQRAIHAMSPEEASRVNHIGHIVPRDDKENYLSRAGSPTQSSAYAAQFWRKRDPLLSSDYNERMLEHYNRMAYVNLRFGIPRQNIMGWETERGMIYIRYGKPSQWVRTQPDEKMLGGTEIWYYPRFSFRFEDHYSSGKFLLDNPSLLASESAYNEHSEDYVFPAERLFPVTARVYQFKSQSGLNKIRVYYSALIKSMDPDYETYGPTGKTQTGFFITDSERNILSKIMDTSLVEPKETRDAHVYKTTTMETFIQSKEPVQWSLELKSLGEFRYAMAGDSLTLRSFSSRTLDMSDVVLADYVDENKPYTVFANTQGVLQADKPLYFFAEVYNLTLEKDQSRFVVEAGLAPHATGGIRTFLQKIFGNTDALVYSTFEQTGTSRDDTVTFALNVSEVPPGNYDAVVRIRDLISGHTTEQKTSIRIVR